MPVDRIPGVTGRRVPGSGRMRTMAGGFRTRVPRMASASEFREAHRQQVRDVAGRFAGGWSFAWQGLEACDNAIYELNEQAHQNLHRAAEELKDEMVEYMKENAPWEDQTGDARAGLQGIVVWSDAEHFTIFLGHGANIHYGLWLEIRHGGRYAILVPTLEYYRDRLGDKIVSMA